jgi:tetratricopeptide (TPR) repeat protein
MTIEDIIKQAEEDYKEAFRLYSKAIDVLPNDPDLYSARGVVLFHLDRKEDSLLDMNKAVDLEPNYSYRYSSRAYIKASLRMTEDAILDYKKCTELDPEDAIAWNNMGLLEDQLGWNKKAGQTFKKADSLENVLKDKDIPIENESELSEPKPEIPISKNRIIKEVFTRKETFKEFVKFVRSGFKIKNK